MIDPNQPARATLTRRVRREQLLKVIGELEPCRIGIEASTGAFYWQRQFDREARSRSEDHVASVRETIHSARR
jgi:hypothetical protein